MSDKIDRIVEFPQDNQLWWIRWVDKYEPKIGRTGSASVKVLLSKITNNHSIDSLSLFNSTDLAWQETKLSFKTIATGAVPRLMIGAIFQNGIHVGDLPSKTEKFNFMSGRDYHGVHEAGESLAHITLPWMERKGIEFKPLGMNQYILGEFSRSKCLVFKQGDEYIIIPCHEIFRVLYAPQQELAQAITGGAWNMSWHKVANPEKTGAREDGIWQICLRKSIKDTFAPALAHLIIDPEGLSAANAISSHFLADKNNADYEKTGRRMHAVIPFAWENLTIIGEFIVLNKKPVRYLCLRLTGINFPFPHPMLLFRDNPGHGEVRVPADRQNPHPVRKLNESADGVVPVASDEDPDAGSHPIEIEVKGTLFINEPKIEKYKNPESFTYQGHNFAITDQEYDGASPGIGTYGRTNKVRTSYSAAGQTERSPRFTKITEMLDRLKRQNRIQHWKVISPPDSGSSRGDARVWLFPIRNPSTYNGKKIAWAYLDGGTKERRAALLCAAQVDDRTLYWLEIETRPNEGFTSWLFVPQYEGEAVEDFFAQVLLVCAMERGVLRPHVPNDLQQYCCAMGAWRHTPSPKGEDRPYNEAEAFAAMREVLNKAG